MSSLDNQFILKTGNWNAPQIISFDSLFTTYSAETVFGKQKSEKIASVVGEWKEKAPDTIQYLENSDRKWSSYLPTLAGPAINHPKCTYTHSIRAAHVTHPDTPDLIYKIYKMTPGRGNPMATTLRAPMGALVADTISKGNLTELRAVKEGLFPVVSREAIERLDQEEINVAFITCSERADVLSYRETVKTVKMMTKESQRSLANQVCQIPLKTGLVDFHWLNLNIDPKNKKLYILDTEPLYGELFIDKLGEGFGRCRQLIPHSDLSRCAKEGLKNFKKSSQENELMIFENTAQSFLEKLT